MSKWLFPRATTAERTSITPEDGEVIYDEDLGTLFYGDGSTVGGVQYAGPPGDTGDTGDTGAPGADGTNGTNGTNGTDGTDGVGVPAGGTAGQVLEKIDGTDYNTQWATASGGTWGSITGTLSDQTDLQSALDAKQATGAYITASSTDTLTNKSGAISQWTNDSGYLTSYTEVDTLQTVTGRGATTTNTVTLSPSGNNDGLIANGAGSGSGIDITHVGGGVKLNIGTTGAGDLINAGTFVVDNSANVTANNLSGTNTGDQDLSGLQPLATVLTNTTASFTTTLAGNIATNNAKVTNATHTGDVTGSTALTISAGAVDIAMLSATGTASSSTYLRGDNTWASISGSGDVSKVGTPVDNQVGVWTGDGTIEGTSGFTWSGSNLAINGTVNLAGNSEAAVFGDDTYVTKYITIRDGAFYAARWGLQASTNLSASGTCLMSSSKPIAFKANTSTDFASLTTFDLMIDTSGDILVSGTVDGRDVATDGTKLDGIEALADVTDTANVTAAGALMDSEVDADIKTLSLPASTTISAFGASLVDDASASAARTTLGVDLFIESDVTGVSGADAVTNIISLTQAEYDAITPNASTFYIIEDA